MIKLTVVYVIMDTFNSIINNINFVYNSYSNTNTIYYQEYGIIIDHYIYYINDMTLDITKAA